MSRLRIILIPVLVSAGLVNSDFLQHGHRNTRQTASSSFINCFNSTACTRIGSNMIRSLVTQLPFDRGETRSVRQSCQSACESTEDCRYFTWYEKNGAFPFSCFLYSSCEKTEPCSDCVTGPEKCRSEEESQCSPVGEDYGGSWYCFPDVDLSSPVPQGTKCIWQCPGQSSYHECHNGEWNNEPGQARCMCHKIGTEHQGQVLCYPQHSMDEAVSSGTYCLHTCHGHPKTEMVCDHSLWSNSPLELSCHGGNSSQPGVEGLDLKNLGSLASSKLQQMRAKENIDKPVMKTKIDGEIFTMKKVINPTRFNPDELILRPEPTSNKDDDILGNTNFFQKLQSSQEILRAQSFLPSLSNTGVRPTSSHVLFKDLDPEFTFSPTQTSDIIQRTNTINKPKIIRLEIPDEKEPAVFPQRDIITLTTPKPSFSDFGFHEIPAPGAEELNLFKVSSQLRVGSNENNAPSERTKEGFTPGTVLSVQTGVSSDVETLNIERQMEKLHELEQILQNTDNISPITLEMIEDALIHLNQKKSIPTRSGKDGSLGFQVENVRQIGENTREILTSGGKITTRGESPILLPHQGGHMVPMSDKAILKQTQLRRLRLEMLKMKDKLSELESQGITPTREHVLDNLQLIKDISKEERPFPNVIRENRAPVKFIQIPLVKEKDPSPTSPGLVLLTTTRPIIIHNSNQLLGVNPNSFRSPETPINTDFSNTNLSPNSQKMTEEEMNKELSLVIEGLTELSKRFPVDLTELVTSFEQSGTDEEHIIDLTQNPQIHNTVRNVNNGCVKPEDPENGRILCNTRDLAEGSKCIIECDLGFLPAHGEILECRTGSWSISELRCEQTLSLLIGGYNAEEGELADVELFDPSGQCNSRSIAPLPAPRRGLVAAYIDGFILACAGVNNTESLNECWKYLPGLNRWVTTSPLHSERHFGSVVGASGTLIVLGGRDGSATPMALGGMEQWREGKWHEVNTKMSLERSYQCATPITRNKLMVTGGYSWNTILGRVETLQMSQEKEWQLLPPLRTPRYLHSCINYPSPSGDTGVLVSGGYSEDYLNSTEIFDFKTNTWSYSGEISEPRQGSIILLVDGKPTIFGGFNNYDKYPTLVEQFDPDLGMWFPLREELLKGRRYFAGVNVPASIFPWCKP